MSEEEIKLSESYTYYAFVSYSHKDEKWAKWIQAALEHYRLPAAVRKEAGKPLPQRIHPVFRDATDLGAGKLADNLRRELDQSRFLIVVCSPNSAKSNEEGRHWVNDEVKRFCELGRADHVIPVIAEGTAETSFCPMIREEGLLGLDATIHSRDRILNDLVAKILGLRPDELWRREERRLRAKRRWRIFAASLATSFAVLGGYIAWDCTRTVTRAFADYVDSYGLPEGISPLTEEQVSHRHVHYRFEFQGYRCEWFGKSIHADSAAPSLLRALGFRRVLKKVFHLDSSGEPASHDDFLFEHRAPSLLFDYSKNGLLNVVNHCHGDGSVRFVARWEYDSSHMPPETAVVSFRNAGGKETANAPTLFAEIGVSDKRVPEDEIEIHRIIEWKVHFASSGRMDRIAFQNGFHRSVRDALNISAVEIHRSSDKTLFRLVPYGGKDIKVNASAIYSGRSFADDPSRNSWDVDGIGYGGISRELLANGIIRTTFLDGDGNPKWHPARWWTFREQTVCDGNVTKVRFDTPEEIRGGVFGVPLKGADDADYGFIPPKYYRLAVGHESAFDSHGFETNRVFIDREGHPIMTEDGYAGYRSMVDNSGWTTNRIFVDENMNPVALEDGGHSGWAKAYDGKHRQTAFWYLGKDGKPLLNHREFFAGWEADRDANGNMVAKRFFGVNGLPILLPKGFASWTAAFDDAGNETNTVWCGENGLPLLQPEGFAARSRVFDDYGNLTNIVYLGEDFSPIRQPEGYAGLATRFDRNGRPTERSFFDTAMHPVMREGGYAGWSKAYDETGNETNRMYRGTEGELVAVADNGFGKKIGPVAGWWKRFGPKGDMIAAGTIGTNGLPVENALGWATWRLENGEEAWFDAAGRPIRQTGIGSKTSWDTPSIRTTWHFDRGTAKPVADKKGAFGEREWLNAFGEVTNRLFLASDETPVVTADGHSGIAYEYGVFGKERKKTKTTWYGPDGKPVMSKDWNCAVLIETYDDWGKDTAHIKYDERGNLIEQYPDEGAAYRLFEMLHRPQTYTETKMTWVGTNGLPVVGKKSGYAWRTHDYGEDQLTKTNRYILADGLPAFFEGGYCGTIIVKDHHRNETNLVYIGQGDKPVVHSKYGYASRSRTYDYSWGDGKEKVKMTGEAYFDAEGHPVSLKAGEAGWRDKFDDYGRQIERTYFGTNGLPVMTKYGFATRRMFYDETTGVETNRVLLDADGEVIQPKKKRAKARP